MSVGVGPINTGLVTRNYDSIEQFERMYAKNADALKTSSSGTMKAVSEEDVKAINLLCFYVISKIYRTLIWASLLQRDIYFTE